MKLSIMKVIGNSMHPTLESGAFVLVCWHAHLTDAIPADRPSGCSLSRGFAHRLFRHRVLYAQAPLQVGDIVAVSHPTYGRIIKRVAHLEYGSSTASKAMSTGQPQPSGAQQLAWLRLRGDNQEASTSEAAMGAVAAVHLIGRVVYQSKARGRLR